MDFILGCVKTHDFWGELFIDIQTSLNKAERLFGVVFKKSPNEFSDWCAEQYQNNPHGFRVSELGYEYKMFVTEQLTFAIHQQYPNIRVSLEESHDGCDRFNLYVNTRLRYTKEDGDILAELRAELCIF